jgi:hypothetical protein
MILIQSDKTRSFPHHFDAACAFYGAMDLNIKTKLITIDDVKSGEFDFAIKNNIAVGSIDFMNDVFIRLGLKNIPNVPKVSESACAILTLGQVREYFKNLPQEETKFIKPVQRKRFGGFLINNVNYVSLNGFPDELNVYLFEKFSKKIISEYRIYIHRDKIIDCRNYSGMFSVLPDFNFVKKHISLNKNFPCSYTIDIGIFSDGENVVVEYDDMWSVGNYGVENTLYLEMLIDRFKEIKSSNN